MNSSLDEYYQLNAGAHRKSNIQIKPPALTCLLGFWAPYPPGSGNRDVWKRDIDKLMIQIIRQMRVLVDESNVRLSSQVDDFIVLFGGQYHSRDLTSSESALSSVAKHISDSDYKNIKIETKSTRYAVTFSFELHSEYLSLSMVLQHIKFPVTDAYADDAMFSHVQSAFSHLSEHLNPVEHIEDDEAKLKKSTEILYSSFWNNLIRKLMGSNYEVQGEGPVGSVFADFRGIIISDETRTFRDQAFSEPGMRSNPRWGDASVPDLQNIIGDMGHEITASYMLSGRAIYMTNLGPQSMEPSTQQRVSTRYIVYAHQRDLSIRSIKIVNKWQLGRLIDRLHWLGVHRLAALKNLPQLRAASQTLAGLDDVQRQEQSQGGERNTLDRRTYLAMQDKLKNISKDISGGLLYRTERSRYYVSNFRRMAVNLRIDRVEGYQPYDLFIEQRLGSIFSFIDRLGVRYERALSETARYRENSVFYELLSIQEYGEFPLFCILVPYYVYHLVEASGLFFGYNEAGAFFVWCSSIVIYHIHKSRKDPRPAPKIALACAIYLSLIAIFATLSWSSWRQNERAAPNGLGRFLKPNLPAIDKHEKDPQSASPPASADTGR